jgi:hypothetical protein
LEEVIPKNTFSSNKTRNFEPLKEGNLNLIRKTLEVELTLG